MKFHTRDVLAIATKHMFQKDLKSYRELAEYIQSFSEEPLTFSEASDMLRKAMPYLPSHQDVLISGKPMDMFRREWLKKLGGDLIEVPVLTKPVKEETKDEHRGQDAG